MRKEKSPDRSAVEAGKPSHTARLGRFVDMYTQTVKGRGKGEPTVAAEFYFLPCLSFGFAHTGDPAAVNFSEGGGGGGSSEESILKETIPRLSGARFKIQLARYQIVVLFF